MSETENLDQAPEQAEEKPDLFQTGQIRDEMTAIYDAAQKRSSPENQIKTDPQMPTIKGASSEEWKTAQLEWMDLPKAERVRRAQAAADLEADQKEAEKFGLTLDQLELKRQRDAIERQTKEIVKAHENSSELASAAENLRSLGWDTKPAETAKRLTEIAKYVQADSKEGVAWIAEQAGNKALAAHIRSFGRQSSPPPAPSEAAPLDMIERAYGQLPRLQELEDTVIEILETKSFRKTGDYAEDLRTAYKLAIERDKKVPMRKRMEKTYDRVNAAK